MADEADKANETAEVFLAAALRNYKHSPIIQPAGDGGCMQCGADVTPERRWCDATCRDLWQKENAA